MKSRLPGMWAEALHGLAVLLAFTLLMAGTGFVTQRPALATVLVLLFSLPYLVAAVVTKRAYFLYAFKLLGASAYFMGCYASGAPVLVFPLLSVSLVLCLLGVGHHLRNTLGPGLADFPRTTFRAMHMTAAVFTCWALVQFGSVLAQPGFVRYSTALAFLGFAAVYLIHCLQGAHVLCSYAFCLYSLAAAVVVGVTALPLDCCWILPLAAAGLIAFVGTSLHRTRGLRWSRHFYFCFSAALGVAFVLSLSRWSYVVYDLAISSLLAWLTYRWLADAVGPVRRATTNERLVPRFLFYGTVLPSLPVVPSVLAQPMHSEIGAAALAFGGIFAWISWQRRDERGVVRSLYVVAAGMFLCSGLIGLASHLPGLPAAVWCLVVALGALLGLGALYRALSADVTDSFRRALAESVAFPAFLAWYVPLALGEPGAALAGALVALAACLGLSSYLKDVFVRCALGPALAGVLVSVATLLPGQAVPLWMISAAGAALAGIGFAFADRRGRPVAREAASLAWLILCIAAVAQAGGAGGAGAVLFCVAALGAVGAVTMGLVRSSGQARDVFSRLATCLTLLATSATLVLVAAGVLGLVHSGVCLLVLAGAYGVAWGLGRWVWSERLAIGLAALGAVLVIFGGLPGVQARLAWGAAPVLALFVLAAVAQGRFPGLADSAVVAGHVTSIVLGCAVLVLTWSVAGPALVVPLLAYAVLYGLMLRVRDGVGFRIGAVCWASLSLLFLLAQFGNSTYGVLGVSAAFLGLLWVVVGYWQQRAGRASWPLALYLSATVVVLLGGAATLLVTDAPCGWLVFLVGGAAFMCLFVLLRQNIFAHLVTLFFSLLAYDWIKSTTLHYTHDLLAYLIVGAVLIGLLFLLPYMKTVAARWLSLPVFSIFNWQGNVLVAACALGLVMLASSAFTLRITAHPKFCVSCHNMGDFYESWQHSSHKDVACLECHYKPGVVGHLEGKVGAAVQVAKFVSDARWLASHASNGQQPHAIVANESCMRSGCHDQMERNEEVLLFHGKVKFRHAKHMGTHPRGKELNCVSCHGQAAKGEHISVTPTTCVTCHFYGRGEKSVAAGECRTCHLVPAGTVTAGAQSFDHETFLEGNKKVKCEMCHNQVTVGEAAVSPSRCKSCHLDETVEIKDEAAFHRVHVSKGHFDCLQCHDQVKHGIHPTAQSLLASGNCSSCHGGDRHTIQEKIYSGTAVADLDPGPGEMYAAGVSCDGCHTEVRFEKADEMTFTSKASGTRQCGDCHNDESYGENLIDWQTETKERLATLAAALDTQKRAVPPASAREEAQRLLASAALKLTRVEEDGSYGAHNYVYTTEILDSVESDLEKCRGLLAK